MGDHVLLKWASEDKWDVYPVRNIKSQTVVCQQVDDPKYVTTLTNQAVQVLWQDDEYAPAYILGIDIKEMAKNLRKKTSQLADAVPSAASKAPAAVPAAQLQPFEQNLYEEHPATASRSIAEVEAYRKAKGVLVKGNDVPKPILAFDESNFLDFVRKGIEALRHCTSPTCIEAHSWPIALSCRNYLGIAETGSHRALTYVLPAVIHVSRQPPRQQQDGPIAVLVAPTRQLAKTIHNVASNLGDRAGLRSVCAANGDSMGGQFAELKKGCHIFVAMPRRLIQFLEEGKVNLHRCTYLVFDDVDRMLTMGCESHILKIAELCRPDHQTIMWATSWQRNLTALVEDLLNDYVEIRFSPPPLSVENGVEMTVDVCQDEDKEERLAELLGNVLKEKTDGAVVFCDTAWKVDEISFQLRQCGLPAIGLHGKKLQNERDWVVSMFLRGAENVLVTTDKAAHDLNFENVRLVVNYDCPDSCEGYRHRSRHVKRPGAPGAVHTFIVPNQGLQAKMLVDVFENAKQPLNPKLRNMAKNVRSKR
ncbi:probable ATP-dependent RNA helicase DDX5 [Rhipicephalus sanguineus]|uniref:RNA helicase n=1 Tax=Rhipicephalus sanguineus TaxID=34632 RepID=A0A9D4T0K8_RHISA|nr:probable ATP-dependent RNA helicase DDX5 [Rhipicephalus sanguineus]KAH7961752.1 hypothetical protein HPB52_011891 [Rhipicephalus sanguineus]